MTQQRRRFNLCDHPSYLYRQSFLGSALFVSMAIAGSACSDTSNSAGDKAGIANALCEDDYTEPRVGEGMLYPDLAQSGHYLGWVASGLNAMPELSGVLPAPGSNFDAGSTMSRLEFAKLLLKDPNGALPDPWAEQYVSLETRQLLGELARPESTCGDAEMAQITSDILGDIAFDDIAQLSAEDQGAICKVVAAGYYVGELRRGSCDGSSDSATYVRCFKPSDAITQAEMISVAYRALFVEEEIKSGKLSPFRDGGCQDGANPDALDNAGSGAPKQTMVYVRDDCQPDTVRFFQNEFSGDVLRRFFPEDTCYADTASGVLRSDVLDAERSRRAAITPTGAAGEREEGTCYPHWATAAYHEAAIQGLYVIDNPCSPEPAREATRGEVFGTFYAMLRHRCYRVSQPGTGHELFQVAYSDYAGSIIPDACTPVTFENYVMREKLGPWDWLYPDNVRSCEYLANATPVYSSDATYPQPMCLVDTQGYRVETPAGGNATQAPVPPAATPAVQNPVANPVVPDPNDPAATPGSTATPGAGATGSQLEALSSCIEANANASCGAELDSCDTTCRAALDATLSCRAACTDITCAEACPAVPAERATFFETCVLPCEGGGKL